jgi:hypothetical protein
VRAALGEACTELKEPIAPRIEKIRVDKKFFIE